MTIKHYAGRRIRGLSGDTKPSNAEADSEFFETNTGKTFDYSSGSWTERSTGVGSTVSTSELEDSAVTNVKLAGSIANTKLSTDPLARANHTGSQSASTISDFDTEVGNNSAVATNTAKTGISSAQASAITANTAKTGISSAQASAITANTSKTTNATHSGDVTGSGALTIANGAVDLAHLSASGTANSSTYLKGDNTWGSIEAGSDMVLLGTSTTNSPTISSLPSKSWYQVYLTYKASTYQSLYLRLNNSSTGYYYITYANGTANINASNSTTFRIFKNSNSTNGLGIIELLISGNDVSSKHSIVGSGHTPYTNPWDGMSHVNGYWNNTAALTSIGFYGSTGTMNNVSMKVYSHK
jgi:hypothetical protein